MEKKLKEKVDALTAFENYCMENQSVWAFLIAFVNSVTALGVKIQSIFTTESQQEENNKGVTRTKQQKKQDMANEAVAVSQGLQAYAISISDMELFELMSRPYSHIMKSKDSPAIASCQLVRDTAIALPAEAIEPFGISEAVLNTLSQSITDFKDAAPTTRNVIAHKTVLTNNCAQLVNEGNMIMRKQLLKIGRQFKKTNPDFYAGLVANAKVGSHAVHAKIRIKLYDDVTSAPLANATVSISGTELSGMTNSKGACTITRVPQGQRTVSIVLSNYIPMELEINFQRGHSATRTVQLSPAFDIPAVKEAERVK